MGTSMSALNLVLAGLALQAATPTQEESTPSCFGPILVGFDSGSAQLSQRAIAQLDAFTAARLRPSRMVVTGSTDTVGSAAANRRLSRRRAEAVARHLARNAVPRDYISVVGAGEARLFVDTPDDTPERSNRVVLVEEYPDPAEAERYEAYWSARPGQAPVC
jgi:outer membrane protein OmpA-like peptidoglycan-associated protein